MHMPPLKANSRVPGSNRRRNGSSSSSNAMRLSCPRVGTDAIQHAPMRARCASEARVPFADRLEEETAAVSDSSRWKRGRARAEMQQPGALAGRPGRCAPCSGMASTHACTLAQSAIGSVPGRGRPRGEPSPSRAPPLRCRRGGRRRRSSEQIPRKPSMRDYVILAKSKHEVPHRHRSGASIASIRAHRRAAAALPQQPVSAAAGARALRARPARRAPRASSAPSWIWISAT